MKTLTYKNKTSIGVINVHSMLGNNVTTTSSNKLSLILSLCALALSACTQVPDKQLASVEQPSGEKIMPFLKSPNYLLACSELFYT